MPSSLGIQLKPAEQESQLYTETDHESFQESNTIQF